MTILDQPNAFDRSDELTRHETFGDDFSRLGNHAYNSARRVESKEGEYAKEPIDGDVLATNTVNDIIADISSLPRVSEDFQAAVNDATPEIKERIEAMVKDRVQDGRFYGNGHHVRQYICANVQDVVGQKMGL